MINGVGGGGLLSVFVFMQLTQRAAVSSYNKGPQEWPALGPSRKDTKTCSEHKQDACFLHKRQLAIAGVH